MNCIRKSPGKGSILDSSVGALPTSEEESQLAVTLQRTAKNRLIWTEELHQLFVECVERLGTKGVPKAILEEMKVDGLTRENIASHLQKYRLQKKRKMDQDPSSPSDATNAEKAKLISNIANKISAVGTSSVAAIVPGMSAIPAVRSIIAKQTDKKKTKATIPPKPIQREVPCSAISASSLRASLTKNCVRVPTIDTDTTRRAYSLLEQLAAIKSEDSSKTETKEEKPKLVLDAKLKQELLRILNEDSARRPKRRGSRSAAAPPAPDSLPGFLQSSLPSSTIIPESADDISPPLLTFPEAATDTLPVVEEMETEIGSFPEEAQPQTLASQPTPPLLLPTADNLALPSFAEPLNLDINNLPAAFSGFSFEFDGLSGTLEARGSSLSDVGADKLAPDLESSLFSCLTTDADGKYISPSGDMSELPLGSSKATSPMWPALGQATAVPTNGSRLTTNSKPLSRKNSASPLTAKRRKKVSDCRSAPLAPIFDEFSPTSELSADSVLDFLNL
eukprot:TRINITY_DN2670_c1_g1_i1.p1 TRINITY_DN2670_c1_g1~~TRINITY_DN2670_c1_g1_i1.p1  ORF type:complete len:506 (-),score=16.87 TRINITY_DN2670_c1_g1_i1:89-1606(-)